MVADRVAEQGYRGLIGKPDGQRRGIEYLTEVLTRYIAHLVILEDDITALVADHFEFIIGSAARE